MKAKFVVSLIAVFAISEVSLGQPGRGNRRPRWGQGAAGAAWCQFDDTRPRFEGRQLRRDCPDRAPAACRYRGFGRGGRWASGWSDERQGWYRGRGASGWSDGRQGWTRGRGAGWGSQGYGPCVISATGDPLVLDEPAQAALREALLDEYAAEAYYGKLTEKFGAPRPFVKLYRAEGRHVRALLTLFERGDVEPPKQAEAIVPEVPATLAEAVRVAIEHERANGALYEKLIGTVSDEDVKTVFAHLRDASMTRHLPALQRCLNWAD